MDDYIQIGVISARAPDGSALPSVPIYTKRTPEAERAEEAALRPVARIFVENGGIHPRGKQNRAGAPALKWRK